MSAKRKNRGYRAFVCLLAAIGAAALLAGWLLDRSGLAAVPSSSAEQLAAIRFSEVQNHANYALPGLGSSAWIEIENASAAPVSLKGLRLTRDDRLKKTLVFPNVTLEAGEYLLICADGSANVGSGAALHAPFTLPKSGAHEIYLYDEGANLIDTLAVPSMAAGESYCRTADGEWTMTAQPTPGEANVVANSGTERVAEDAIALSEVMAANAALFPDEDGAYHDYIEITNRSDSPVDLKGYGLTDNPDRPGKWVFPSAIIQPGQALAVHCSGENRTGDPAHLHTGFKLSAGETVRLHSPDGALIGSVTLPELRVGQALSWVDGGWSDALPPTPNAENTLEAAFTQDGERRARLASAVTINEVMARPETEDNDWLELMNSSDAEIDLSGYGLSNDLKRPRKWQFPQGTVIPAHGFLPVVLAGDGAASVKNYLAAPFAASAAGGRTLSLCDPGGNILDCLCLPTQYSGIAFGRDTGGNCGYLPEATPMSANAGAALSAPAQAPTYSVMGGLYHTGDTFNVTLTAQPGARVYYTLDCTDPGEGKTLYTGEPIPVSGTTILRTRVYVDGCLPSVMDTQSYLFDVNAAEEAPYVVSLVSDPEGLFSDATGIMAMGPNARASFPYGSYNEGANFWMDWEREAHVELFTGAGETAISQECGIKLHGRNTRAYELKSFKVMAKSRYGSDRFRYPIFAERPYDDYEAFILRYAGQDYKKAFMRDVVMTNLAANTSVMYMEAMESIVYLNGEYYSAMYIRENVSPFSLARKEGWTGQEDELDLVKSGYEVKQGSNDDYIALKAYLESTDNNTQAVYDRIASEVDIDNFIEYCTLNIVFCPPDTVNVKRYRNPAADDKWRWVIYDLDRGLRTGDTTNALELMAQGTNAQLFRAFMYNDTLRNRFLTNLNTALSTYLSSASMEAAAREQFERVKPLLPDYLNKVGVTQAEYERELKLFIDCIRKRPEKLLSQCQKTLRLSDAEMQAYFADAYAAIEAGK